MKETLHSIDYCRSLYIKCVFYMYMDICVPFKGTPSCFLLFGIYLYERRTQSDMLGHSIFTRKSFKWPEPGKKKQKQHTHTHKKTQIGKKPSKPKFLLVVIGCGGGGGLCTYIYKKPQHNNWYNVLWFSRKWWQIIIKLNNTILCCCCVFFSVNLNRFQFHTTNRESNLFAKA